MLPGHASDSRCAGRVGQPPAECVDPGQRRPLLEAQASSAIENIVTTTDLIFRHEVNDDAADPATNPVLRYRTALRLGSDAVETGWLQASAADVRTLPMSLALAMLLLAAVGTMAVIVSVRASRRISAVVALIAWLAALSAWATAVTTGMAMVATGLALAVTAFWLVDRGIPGNRRRPAWFKAYAISLLLLALTSLVLALRALT